MARFCVSAVGLLAVLSSVASAATSRVATDMRNDFIGRRLRAYHSEYVVGSVMVPGAPAQTFPMVVSDIGRYPFGTIVRTSFVVWDDEFYSEVYSKSECPRTDMMGPAQECKYMCYPVKNFKFPPNTAVMVERGPDNELKCNFLQKIEAAQNSGAAVILVHSYDETGITMDTNSDDTSLRIEDSLTITPFLIKKNDGDKLKEFLRSHHALGVQAMNNVQFSVDMRNVAPENKVLEVTLWRSMMWNCGLACDRVTSFLYSGEFSNTMAIWMLAGVVKYKQRFLIDECSKFTYIPSQCPLFCIRNGRYCNMDPDGNAGAGQSGRVGVTQAVVYKCIEQLADEYGKKEAMVNFQTEWTSACMKAANFTLACSQESFLYALRNHWTDADFVQAGRTPEAVTAAVQTCTDKYVGDATIDLDEPIPFLDDDMQLKNGYVSPDWGEVTAVAIDPTLIVGGNAYRGVWEMSAALKYICSRFTDGAEPSQCRFRGVSDCQKGGDGFNTCFSPANIALNKTRCLETFSGFQCVCDFGFTTVRGMDVNDPEDFTCVDANECVQYEAVTRIKCGDDKICLNNQGNFECVEAVEVCNKEHKYGGCFVSDKLKDANGEPLHGCVSHVAEMRHRGTLGDVSIKEMPTHECSCQALPCHMGDGRFCRAECPLGECLHAENPQVSICKPGISSASAKTIALGVILGFAGLIAVVSFSVYLFRRQNRNLDLTNGIMHQLTGLKEQMHRAMARQEGYVDLKDMDDSRPITLQPPQPPMQHKAELPEN